MPCDFTHVESNEQTELTSKIETNSWIESRLTALGGGSSVVEGLSTKEKGLMDMDNSGVFVEEGDITGLNGNEKNTIKETNQTKKIGMPHTYIHTYIEN